MKYIQSFKKNGCVFCDAIASEEDSKHFIVHRAEHSFVILNLYPYTSGSLMVLPYKHVPELDALTPEIRFEMIELVNKVTQVLTTIYRPQGFNIGINMGEAAGAGIEQHLHIHIVPRWNGDTNFMTSVGQVRVLPETLEETYRRVMEVW